MNTIHTLRALYLMSACFLILVINSYLYGMTPPTTPITIVVGERSPAQLVDAVDLYFTKGALTAYLGAIHAMPLTDQHRNYFEQQCKEMLNAFGRRLVLHLQRGGRANGNAMVNNAMVIDTP